MIGNLTWKQIVRGALVLLVVVDAALLLWTVQERESNPRSQAAQRDELRRVHGALGGDVQLAADIRTRLPEVERQCDRFLKEQLLPVAAGYSSVVEDLNSIATGTGLSTKGVQYKQRELDGRGVVEVQVTAIVEGSYANLVRFINELERAKQFYLLEELALMESSTGSAIRLNMQLKTYFRLKA